MRGASVAQRRVLSWFGSLRFYASGRRAAVHNDGLARLHLDRLQAAQAYVQDSESLRAAVEAAAYSVHDTLLHQLPLYGPARTSFPTALRVPCVRDCIGIDTELEEYIGYISHAASAFLHLTCAGIARHMGYFKARAATVSSGTTDTDGWDTTGWDRSRWDGWRGRYTKWEDGDGLQAYDAPWHWTDDHSQDDDTAPRNDGDGTSAGMTGSADADMHCDTIGQPNGGEKGTCQRAVHDDPGCQARGAADSWASTSDDTPTQPQVVALGDPTAEGGPSCGVPSGKVRF